VLSLSDLRYLRGLAERRSSVAAGTQLSTDVGHDDSEPRLATELLAGAQQSWNDEKQCLLSSVESLKTLLARVQPDNSVSNTRCYSFPDSNKMCYVLGVDPMSDT